ncbi:hypothetical protein CHS0354_025325 [Potamilus streckersoni]|uniref:Uncharacterized protein n=1 Tax=Potamilus streckersoni TaxID=2493646 RepID=A0AAE0RUS7_9BIVA|nr:hypothetical protein CHS0354_025325 [Potamilus streckersoni]
MDEYYSRWMGTNRILSEAIQKGRTRVPFAYITSCVDDESIPSTFVTDQYKRTISVSGTAPSKPSLAQSTEAARNPQPAMLIITFYVAENQLATSLTSDRPVPVLSSINKTSLPVCRKDQNPSKM